MYSTFYVFAQMFKFIFDVFKLALLDYLVKYTKTIFIDP